MELLLGYLLVYIIDGLPVEISDVLETIDNEGFEGFTVENLVVYYYEVLQGPNALNLRKQDERVQVVMLEDNLLELGELLQLLQVLMIHDEVEAYVSQMHFFDLIVEL